MAPIVCAVFMFVKQKNTVSMEGSEKNIWLTHFDNTATIIIMSVSIPFQNVMSECQLSNIKPGTKCEKLLTSFEYK